MIHLPYIFTGDKQIVAFYLSLKEIWRNKGRFFLFSLVIALIAILVLFTNGLAFGLASANKEYLENINAQLLIFKEDVDYSTIESRIEYKHVKRIGRIDGVSEAGAIAFSNVKLVVDDHSAPIDVSFIGVQPDKPGSPRIVAGYGLSSSTGKITVIDRSVADSAGVNVGDDITIKTNQGDDDKFYNLRVTGITDSQQYFFRPSIFVKLPTWDRYRPRSDAGVYSNQPVVNVIAVLVEDLSILGNLSTAISAIVDDVETTDIKTAYESAPGYSEQQGTLNTIQAFTFLIGTLVIGGFFQIQTLQKIPQIGMLKAIGVPNRIVAGAAILQILLVTMFGVLIGALATFGLVVGMPPNIPVVFSINSVLNAIVSLLLIGPLGGMVSIRLALKVEPLTALGG